ncbi:MAG: DUF4148 domain-containing protein [Paraburkholderia sp.]|uniref:DUF4148 domain-containing protein n=1 Tax=Paraburkholderia sp. TaxID=1926495 RepID=UPI001222215F|nr:DUF4148 domain-containing protein [Paraburkholderia sp.]TAL94293.1 MAG: DUF4148 domain-containing protein [Paraburkholderia sp.]
MKSLIKAVALAVVLAAPVVSFAQSNGPVTRAQVRAELAQLEKAGYNPNIDSINYPENLQAAEARVSAQNSAVQNSGYGASTNGSSQAGVRGEFTASSYSPPVYVAH